MRGITLIELMIVVVIVAILATVSYPSYREFAARAKRNEAKAALLMAATNQERFYLQNNQFSADLTQLGFSASPFTTDSRSYVITIAAPVPTADFTVTATYQLGGAEALQAGEVDRLVDAPVHLAARIPEHGGVQLDVLAHRHMWIQRVALEHHCDVAVFGFQVVDDGVVNADLAA